MARSRRFGLALMFGACSGLLLACSELLFSGYKIHEECETAASCQDAAPDVPPIDVSNDNDPGDVFKAPAKWANWPMPNPRFDASPFDGASFHFVTYTGFADGILDNVTALYWNRTDA